MQKELLSQAISIFDSPEKWNAFVEIANQKEKTSNHFTSKVKIRVVTVL